MKRKYILITAFIGIALILLLVVVYSGLKILESHNQQYEESAQKSKWIVRDGVRYYPRQDIMTVLLMGIDCDDVDAGSDSDQGHTAEMIVVLVFDEKIEQCKMLLLNRDTMVMMSGVDEAGRKEGECFTQLALSYAYGSDREDSCENVRDTVSDLLYGLAIDYYVSLDMDGIALINDAVGGVTVHVTDDFSGIDASIGKGEVTLYGQQVMNFVCTREGLGDQLNSSRMERHKTYFESFMEALRDKLSAGSTEAIKLYKQASPYLVTDCTANILLSMMGRYANYELSEILTIDGENRQGDKYMEYYLDEENLDEIILKLFYAPVE